MNIKFSGCEVEFEGATVPMRNRDTLQESVHFTDLLGFAANPVSRFFP